MLESSGVSLSQVSVSRPISILALMNPLTIISFLFLTDLAFSVASLIVDTVSVPILLVSLIYTKLSWLQLFVIWYHSDTLIGFWFILSCVICNIVPGGTQSLLSWLTFVFGCLSCAGE